MERVDKKAQVGIIVVVLLILIVLVGIVIIWNVVNVVEDESENIDIDLVGVELDVEDVVMFPTGASKIRVNRRAGGGEIDGFRVVFYDEEGKSEVKVIDEGLGELESMDFNIGSIGIGNVESVGVYPFYGENIGREFKSGVGDVIEVPSGMVGWWRFDDESDFIGENDGEMIGSGLIDEGRLVLNGGYFKISDDDSLDLDEGVSVSVWILGSGDGVIVEKGENYKVFLRGGKVVFSYGENEFESLDGIGEDWNHIVVSADFDGVYKIIVNEVLGDSGVLGGGVVVNNNDLKIGEGFVGEIDEVMIFDKALSVEQVDGLFGFGRE